MAKRTFKAGATSQTIDIFIQDSSSTTGAGLSGLVYNSSGLKAYYRKGATGSATAITLATQTVGGAWSSGGFVEIDATNMKGVYRLDVPDTVFASSPWATIYVYGATNAAPVVAEVEIVAYDPFDTVRLGLTAMPNVASGSAGAIVTAGTGTAQISTSSGQVILQTGTGTGQLDFTSGVVKANVTQFGGSAGTFASGRPEVNTSHISGSAVSTSSAQIGVNVVNFGGSAGTFASGRPEVNTSHIAGSSVSTSAAQIGVNVVNAGGTAWGSGAITAAAIAADAVSEIADAVWDELLSGHLTAGSFGAVVNAMGLHSGAILTATSSTARLAASGPSATSDTYSGCWLVITSGTGIGQARLIYDYVGSSKQCSITPNWITTPDANDTYVVIPAASINAIYGAVGSVAGNVDGSVATATALGAQAKADVNAEVVDALATDTYAEPGQGTPSATLSLSAKIGYLFKAWRNKTTQTSTTYSLYNDDAATVDQKATTSDDGTTFSKAEITTGP